MKDPIVQLMLIIRDLLGVSESLIKRGRINEVQEDFVTSYIAVDTLAPAVPVSQIKSYNGATEKATHGGLFSQPVTIDFYGKDAYTNAYTFHAMLKSQQAIEEQKKRGITTLAVSSITDVKQLTGHQYSNQYQAELRIMFSTAAKQDILRIDTADITFLRSL